MSDEIDIWNIQSSFRLSLCNTSWEIWDILKLDHKIRDIYGQDIHDQNFPETSCCSFGWSGQVLSEINKQTSKEPL